MLMDKKTYALSNINKRFIILVLFCPVVLTGQNLVRNGDFETYTQCPVGEGNWDGYVEHWSTLFGTPNYLNCQYYGNNPSITPAAHSGTGLASCVWFDTDYGTPPNVAREYLVGELSVPLEQDQSYYVSFWIYVPDGAPTIERQQVSVLLSGAHEVIGEYTITAPTVYENTEFFSVNNWHRLGGCFSAAGGEDQIILGNFLTNEQTVYVDTSIGFTNFNFIDDVALYSLESLVPNDTTVLVGTSYPFDRSAYRSYRLLGEEVDMDSYRFEEEGTYEVGVFLEDCGQIGSFTIYVEGCDDYIAGLPFVPLLGATYCTNKGIELTLPAYEDVAYYYQMQEISDSISFNMPGEHDVYMLHDVCGELSRAAYVGLDCGIVRDSSCFYVPNAFSPNRDGTNDMFQVEGNCRVVSFRMEIYNRWGGHVFSSTDVERGWDGQTDDEACEAGIYLYFVEMEFESGYQTYRQFMAGELTLVR